MEKVNKPTGAARKALLWEAYKNLRTASPLTCSRLLAQWAREQVDNIPVGSVGGGAYDPGADAEAWLERYAPSLPPVEWELLEMPTGETRDDWPFDPDEWVMDAYVGADYKRAPHGARHLWPIGSRSGRKGWFKPQIVFDELFCPTGASRGVRALLRRWKEQELQGEYAAGTYHRAEVQCTLRVKVAYTGRVLAEDSLVSREGEWREVVQDYLLHTVLDTLRRLFGVGGEECHGEELVRALSLRDTTCPPLDEGPLEEEE